MNENTNFVIIPSSLDNIKEIIAKPIDAILVGLANFSCGIVNADLKKISDINDLCKNKHKKLYLNINKLFTSEEGPTLEEVLIEVDKLNLDAIFFEDLGLLNIYQKTSLKTPLIWNQNHLVTNYQTINYYLQEGVEGANLATEITLDEIKEIRSNTDALLFVKVFGWCHMMNTPRNLISNYLEYIGEVKESGSYFLYEEERKQYYLIKEEIDGTFIYNYEILNALTLLPELKSNYSLIVDGTNIDNDIFMKIVDIYIEAINNKDANNIEELSKSIENILDRPTGLGFFNKKTIFKVKNV